MSVMAKIVFMRSTPGRLLRGGAGAALMALGVYLGGAAGLTLAAIGVVPIGASVANVCLFAPLFGFDLRGRPLA